MLKALNFLLLLALGATRFLVYIVVEVGAKEGAISGGWVLRCCDQVAGSMSSHGSRGPIELRFEVSRLFDYEQAKRAIEDNACELYRDQEKVVSDVSMRVETEDFSLPPAVA